LIKITPANPWSKSQRYTDETPPSKYLGIKASSTVLKLEMYKSSAHKVNCLGFDCNLRDKLTSGHYKVQIKGLVAIALEH
jgi:hypothetical protein